MAVGNRKWIGGYFVARTQKSCWLIGQRFVVDTVCGKTVRFEWHKTDKEYKRANKF